MRFAVKDLRRDESASGRWFERRCVTRAGAENNG